MLNFLKAVMFFLMLPMMSAILPVEFFKKEDNLKGRLGFKEVANLDMRIFSLENSFFAKQMRRCGLQFWEYGV